MPYLSGLRVHEEGWLALITKNAVVIIDATAFVTIVFDCAMRASWLIS